MTFAERLGLIPAPRKLEPREGSLDLRLCLSVLYDPGFEGEAALVAQWIDGALGATDQALRIICGALPPGEGEVCVELRREGDAPFRDPAASEPGGDECYRLEIAAGGVRILARQGAGIVRGGATLRSLALAAGPVLPGLFIEDGPRFPWRGFMLDTARNFFRVEFIERLIDLAALHKLNVFHWHLTDDQAWRLELPSAPELARSGARRLDPRLAWVSWIEGSYSPEDVRRVVAYAAARHITVVPEIETPGHATALLASHPELSCVGRAQDGGPFRPEGRYGIFEDILCAGNEGTFELLGRVFDDVVRLFPGPFVHAGGDEAPKARWLSCPKCRALMKAARLRDEDGALDPERLQGWFMTRVAGLLAERKRRMIGWDEILEGGAPQGAVVASWRGYEGGLAAARQGHEVVMCPQTRACYLDHKHLDLPEEPGNLSVCTVRDSYAFEPIPPGLTAAEVERIRGGQANLWSEMTYFGRQVEYLLFPRLAAIAEALWSPREVRDFAGFSRRLEVYGRALDALGVNRYRGPLE